jgi:hypothetical protein
MAVPASPSNLVLTLTHPGEKLAGVLNGTSALIGDLTVDPGVTPGDIGLQGRLGEGVNLQGDLG